jgi:predicted deacetylase
MLVASIHDVAPATFDEVQRLRDLLAAWGVDRVTLLAVPEYHHRQRLDDAPEMGRWLRACVAAGDEVCLHGYYHVAEARPRKLVDRLRARLFTDGEGELLGLESHELRRRLILGQAMLETVLGAPVRGFVAPAWLEPSGFADVLLSLGFVWHESRYTVERLHPRKRVCAPLMAFATRTRAREAASLTWVTGVGAWAALVPRSRIRLALHPRDLESSAVMACAATMARRLRRGGCLTTYESLRRPIHSGSTTRAARRQPTSPSTASAPNERNAPLLANNSDP